MNERMKIMIGYDGSEGANAALDDLRRAGLPPDAEARVLTVAESWLPPPLDDATAEREGVAPLERTPDFVQEMYARREERIGEARALAERAKNHIQEFFPAWKVNAEACAGSPAREVIAEADEWKPDLIVVGSHGHMPLGPCGLCSTAQKVLTEALCTVRVARPTPARAADDETLLRLIIGTDGSPDAERAVAEVANRSWATGTAVRLVTATEPFHMYGVEPLVQERHARDIQQEATKTLSAAGLCVSSVVREGDPKRVLVKAAEEWDADAIFIGAKGHSFLERTLLGSVSYAVAARAPCTVEVVRRRKN
jgi:nucleotide-binding universal stress UspA family protein